MSMTDNVAKIGKSQDLSPTETGSAVIGNGDFTSQLDKLRLLRNFIVSHNIKETKDQVSTLPTIDLGKLNSIRYGDNGREPSDVEWDYLNARLQHFYSLLSETDLRKFHFKLAVPMLKVTPAALVFCSIFFLLIPNVIAGFFGMHELPTNWLVSRVAFLLWIVMVGALGSMAFILVNALGIQVDPTVDVTDRDSTMFRVLLGALFSVILTLPFGFPTFEEFLKSLKNVDPKDGALLLMPFLFGFSTSLVLTILNRLVDAVQTFFGVNTKSPPPK
jgi:hypothetical protein